MLKTVVFFYTRYSRKGCVMKKYFIMFCLLFLSACGGGSGGGGQSGSGEVIRPSVTPTADVVKKSNGAISSTIDNESKRSAHVLNTLGADYYNTVSNGTVSVTRGASPRPPMQNDGYCISQRTCNDVAFNNMYDWLVTHIAEVDNWEDNQNLRNALILAGFGNALRNSGWAAIKQWIHDNREAIKAQAKEIYADMGEHKDFDITQTDLSVVSHMGENVKIKFTLGENKKINGFEYVSTQAPGVVATLTADRKTEEGTEFAVDSKLYEYTLGGIGETYDPDSGGREISFISDTQLDPETIKDRFLKLIADYKAKGIFFPTFHGGSSGLTQEEIENVVYAEVVAKINNLDEDASDLHYEEKVIKTDLDFQSFGKELGLAYSDFGKIVVSDGDNEFFHGGYDDKKIALNTVQNIGKTMNFKGKAVGIVEKSFNDTTTGKIDIAGDANLAVSDMGNETLSANFTDWYDVTVMRNKDGTNSIAFDNWKNGANTDYQFKHIDSNNDVVARPDGYTVEQFTENRTPSASDYDNVVTGFTEGSLVLDYYGPNVGTGPTEFSGLVMYHEGMPVPKQNGSGYDDRGVHFMMGFGGKKDYVNE